MAADEDAAAVAAVTTPGGGWRDLASATIAPQQDVEATCYGNALAAYGQSGQMLESHWLAPAPIDQRTLFEGNSVLRGQSPRVGALPEIPERVETMVFK